MKKTLLLFAVAIMASCSNSAKDVDSTSIESSSQSVSFNATISPDTRVVDDVFQTNDIIVVRAFDGEAEHGSQATYSYTGTSFAGETNTIVRDNEQQQLSYIAAYPSTISNFGTTFEFTALADQSTSTNQEMSDLLVATLDATTSTTPTLYFGHALSSLVINFDFSGDGTSAGTLTIYGQATTRIDLEAKNYIAESGNTTAFTPANSGSNSYTVIFAPQGIESDEIVAVYTTADKSYTWRTDNELEFESGIQYTYTWAIDTSIDDLEYNGGIYYTGIINEWGEREVMNEPIVTESTLAYASNDYDGTSAEFNYTLASDNTFTEIFSIEDITLDDLALESTITFSVTDCETTPTTKQQAIDVTYGIVDDKLTVSFPISLVTYGGYKATITASYNGDQTTFCIDEDINGYPVQFVYDIDCVVDRYALVADGTTNNTIYQMLDNDTKALFIYDEATNKVSIDWSDKLSVVYFLPFGYIRPIDDDKKFLTAHSTKLDQSLYLQNMVLVEESTPTTVWGTGMSATYGTISINRTYIGSGNSTLTSLTSYDYSILDFIDTRDRKVHSNTDYKSYALVRFPVADPRYESVAYTDVWYDTGFTINVQY